MSCAAVLLALAWAELRDGIEEIESAGTDLRLEDVTSAAPARVLEEAGGDFRRAERRLDNPLLFPLRAVPVLGRQLSSVRNLTAAAADLTRTGSAVATDVRGAVALLPAPTSRHEALESIEASFVTAIRAIEQVDLGPRRALLDRIARERNRLASELAETERALRNGLDLTRAARTLLDGDAEMLLVAANNAEMRAGMGMFLQAGTLRSADGRLVLGDMQAAHDLTLDHAVPVSGDLAERWGFTDVGREWRNLGASPRFAASADVAARMWEAKTGTAIDGVIAVDVAAVVGLLEASGPIQVRDVAIDADNAERFLLHDQYLSVVEGGTAERDSQRARRDLLGDLAQALVAQIESGDPDIGPLVRAVRDAVRGRHILVWSRDPVMNDAWARSAVTGELRADSMLLSLLNRGGNKLDPYVRIDATVAREQARVRVRAVLDNRTPRGEVPYVAGPHPDLDVEAGTYVGFLTLNVPGAARDLDVEGGPIVTAGADGATRVVATQVVVARGEEKVIEFSFRLPATTEIRVEPSARLPAIRWHHGERTFTDRRARTIEL